MRRTYKEAQKKVSRSRLIITSTLFPDDLFLARLRPPSTVVVKYRLAGIVIYYVLCSLTCCSFRASARSISFLTIATEELEVIITSLLTSIRQDPTWEKQKRLCRSYDLTVPSIQINSSRPKSYLCSWDVHGDLHITLESWGADTHGPYTWGTLQQFFRLLCFTKFSNHDTASFSFITQYCTLADSVEILR